MDDLIDVPAGLNGVAVAETTIGTVHGDEGSYHYRRYDATELARTVGFEDAWFLLERGELPDDVELDRSLRSERSGRSPSMFAIAAGTAVVRASSTSPTGSTPTGSKSGVKAPATTMPGSLS